MSSKFRLFSSRVTLRIIVCVNIVVLLMLLYGAWQITRPLPVTGNEILLMERGDGASKLAMKLQDEGIIKQTVLFNIVARIGGFEHDLKAGEYQLPASSNLLDILDTVVSGRSISYPVTLVEGWTLTEMLEVLHRQEKIEAKIESTDHLKIARKLKLPPRNLEGLFFPDTYNYISGESDVMVLLRAYNKMNKVLNDEWRNRSSDLPYAEPYEALIAASIIEKESGVVEEYPIISRVIVNRLNKGMRLQMDPTVIYGLGSSFEGNLTKKHLKQDTEYNTYVRKGLPPTPIAMPGLAALKASMNPAETSALYFVSRGDGTHQFSETLEAHTQAVKKYQQ